MKVIAPFDARIRPPKRFWTALWKPGVQADHPEAEFEIMRRSMVPGAPHVLLNSEESVRVRYLGGFSLWAGIKRVSAAIANWMIRREAREEEERLAASESLEELESRLRDVERSRYFRYVSH